VSDVHIPGYEILAPLGAGGMAHVYQAMQVSLQRKVALKVLRADLGDDGESFKRRFFNEGRTLASIDHPNIVAVYDLGETDDSLYLAMELVTGQNLESLVRAEGVTLERAVTICTQIASALEHTHEKGVIHRDIKPSNVLMQDDATPKLVDFGIARGRRSDVSLTQTGVMVGTPLYMSPEQVQGVAIDQRTDLYALGVTLFWLLTGRHPFDGESPVEIALKHLQAPVPTLPEEVAHLQTLVDRAMAKDPEDRFQSAREFRDALSALDLDDPTLPLRAPATGSVTPTLESTTPSAAGSRETPVPGARGGGWWGSMLAWFRRNSASRAPEADSAQRTPTVEVSTPPPVPGTGTGPPDAGREPPGNATVLQPLEPPAGGDTQADVSLDPPTGTGDETQFLVVGDVDSVEEGLVVTLTFTRSSNPALVGTRVTCTHFPFTIGRDPSADCAIEHDFALSRHHAEILRTDGGYFLTDRSTNGVIVNGQASGRQTVPLPFNSSIRLSRDTILTFQPHLELLPDLTGQRIGERFELEEALHHSIKASTYRGRDLQMPRSVVVKLFSPHLMALPQYQEEFERQARLTMQFKSPHIVKVLEFRELTIPEISPDRPVSYVCTDYMDGGSLARRLDDEDLPGVEQILDWVDVLARALEHAHRHQVVHGDLKPSCVVFDGDGAPYVTDFALAVSEGDGEERAATGTPAFWAPEQWERQAPTERTDQYSLAVLTYLMLTGARPFEGQSEPKVRERNFRRGPEPAHQTARRRRGLSVNSNLSAVLAKAMSVDPDDRYERISAFADALRKAAQAPEDLHETPRVFISYRRQANAGWANLFHYNLKQQFGFDVFIDAKAIDGSPQIPTRVRNEISRCDVFICLLHPDTLDSAWVREEIRLAHEARKPMVPVFSEEFSPSDYREANDEIKNLLDHEAVILLDQKNVYLDAALEALAARVRRLLDARQRLH